MSLADELLADLEEDGDEEEALIALTKTEIKPDEDEPMLEIRGNIY
jgi:hypothetical protein